MLLLESSYCRPPPHDAWAGGSFAAITRGPLRPGCGRRAWPGSPVVAGHASDASGTTTFAQHAPSSRISAKKLAQRDPSSVICAKKLAQHAIKRQFLAFLSTLGELFRARVRTGPSRANFFAHRTQPRADFETNDASAATDAGQYETADTTATEKCTKYSFFSPAKAMAVSTPRAYERAKATPVSGERAAWSTGPRCDTRGRRWGLAGRPVCSRRYKRRQTNTI